MVSLLAGRWHDRPHAPAPGTALCRLDDIADPGVKEVRFGTGRDAFSLIVVRSAGAVGAFLNICPHFQLPLNAPARPDRFLTADGSRLKCAHHLGLFDPVSGVCVDGPPLGDRLVAVPVVVDGGSVRIDSGLPGPA
ncbi:MAG: Rieske 2Fe-2S domain-containing protein [Alphaproteobacteria bacterium]